jgi:hypothetical protein
VYREKSNSTFLSIAIILGKKRFWAKKTHSPNGGGAFFKNFCSLSGQKTRHNISGINVGNPGDIALRSGSPHKPSQLCRVPTRFGQYKSRRHFSRLLGHSAPFEGRKAMERGSIIADI